MVAATVKALRQVAEALVETIAVCFPRHAVHPGRRPSSQALIRLPEEWLPEVTVQVGPTAPWLSFRSLPYPLHVRGRACPALCRERVSCNGLSLGLGPSFHRLDGRYP